MKRLLTLELRDETLRLLAVLDERGRVDRALYELVERLTDGIRRPGSWERPWLCQAFGHDWLERLESDPEIPWAQRPRAR
ncbi:MAG: hypothetical protein MJD61_09910 [Proteobacteria bacterium]|nr:hypothetical protein [Pseudomonadota bacterium]